MDQITQEQLIEAFKDVKNSINRNESGLIIQSCSTEVGFITLSDGRRAQVVVTINADQDEW